MFVCKYGLFNPRTGDMATMRWYRDAMGHVRFVAPSKRGVKVG